MSDKNQFLIESRNFSRQRGLALEIRGGKLHGSFRAQDLHTYNFPTDMSVPLEEWSTIKVSYDFEEMKIQVGDKSISFPLSLPASNLGYVMVGDGGWRNSNSQWFDGYLGRLTIH